MSTWFDEYIPRHVQHLDVYQPGKPIEELERELGISGALKVASNENPLGPSPKALAALPAALAGLHLYPDAGGFALRRKLAEKFGLSVDQFSLGNGSNDLLYQLVLASCDPEDEVLSHELAFLSYRLAAQVAGRPFVAAKVNKDLSCDVDALIAAMTPKTKLVVLGSPNNPTGSVITKAGAEKILAALPARALLVIDEAYAEYASAWPEVDHVDGMELLKKDRRVIVLRTFSKISGLAGIRVGYAAGDKAVLDVLGRVGRTFHVSSLAQIAAIAAVDDDAHLQASAKLARACIERFRTEISAPGVRLFPSLTNFVLIDVGRPAGAIYDALLRRGVIVRPMAAWGLPTAIRISVAKESEQKRVIDTVNDVLRA
ncbi:histidinol-phosphate transaminase [soil metagenome]